MPNTDLRREEPGSLMHTIRRHATELAAYPWATLGLDVAGAQKIVAQIDLMNDRLDRLREELDKATRERDSLARRCAVRFESETKLREVLTALNAAAYVQEEPSKALLDASALADELLGPDSRPSVSETDR